MTTVDFITELFCHVDDILQDVPMHPQAKLCPSEVVTMALLFALKGGGERAFYRWLERDYRPLFPHLPERTRLFRLFAAHQDIGAQKVWDDVDPVCRMAGLRWTGYSAARIVMHGQGEDHEPPTSADLPR
jgi:hypothetical protein